MDWTELKMEGTKITNMSKTDNKSYKMQHEILIQYLTLHFLIQYIMLHFLWFGISLGHVNDFGSFHFHLCSVQAKKFSLSLYILTFNWNNFAPFLYGRNTKVPNNHGQSIIYIHNNLFRLTSVAIVLFS